MITAEQIMYEIENIAPFSTAMGFDNVGLLIGNKNKQSDMVLLALDLTANVIREAADSNSGIVVTHHPVIFHPLKTIDSGSVPYLAVQNDLTVISAHTNLDIAPGGVNDSLAEALGVRSDSGTNEDCMLVGELSEPMEDIFFAETIRENLRGRGLRFVHRNGKVQKIAIACGAGGSSIFAAFEQGADALVTGEIKHHEILFAAEHNMAVFDIGHFRSEDLIIAKLADILNQRLPSAVFKQAKADKDPVFYL